MPKPTSTTITAHKHTDRRANIPTEELRDFVAEDEQSPVTLRYPRDPSLDPQLVWQGKDEQDGEDLAVPAVPIYIQEKIHPQSIIDDLLAQAAKPGSSLREAAAAYQLNMFADFNGMADGDFARKVDFYSHDTDSQPKWSNRLILGDSLLVMASLAEKEGLRGRVQMIYLDPPYGIKFGSNWQVSTRKRDVKDGKAEDATRQPEQIRAFRDTWKLGIHSYLAYLRDRLVVARELLTETGSVFVQIGDENLHLVRSVLDEVFGSENFCSMITISKTAGQTAELLGGVCDYLLWYAKNRDSVKFRRVLVDKGIATDTAGVYRWGEDEYGTRYRLGDDELQAAASSQDGMRIFRVDNITSQRPPGDFPVLFEGTKYRPGKGYWKSGQEGMAKLVRAGRVVKIGGVSCLQAFLGRLLGQWRGRKREFRARDCFQRRYG